MVIKSASCRLYVILARSSPIAVVFRRGPSKQVLILSWNTETHEVRRGQWLKGRIYERRCDLSPSGDKLVYFAANHKAPYHTWTAVSRLPFLTALALWPKEDAWGGGGLFTSENCVELNHGPEHRQMAEGFKTPKNLRVQALGAHAGRGEDDPILSTRLARDGWVLKQPGRMHKHGYDAPMFWSFPINAIISKTRGQLAIEAVFIGIHERDGSWYVFEHRVVDSHGQILADLGRSDWADWSHSGEVLFARDGRLGRVVIHDVTGPGSPEELVNLSALKFEEVPPPPEATRWRGRAPRGVSVSPQA